MKNDPVKQREYQRRYREKNPERYLRLRREQKKRWREKNAEVYRVGMIASSLGISPDEVREWRKGTHCAACGEVAEGRMVIDHDHATGKVRGLLHNKCNIGIAHAKDSPDVAWEWSRFLTKHSFDLRDLCHKGAK